MKNIKIFVLGAAGVGKTSIIQNIVFGSIWNESFRKQKPPPTIEDVYFATLDSGQLTNQTGIIGDRTSSLTSPRNEDRLLFFDVAGIKQNIDIELLKSYITNSDEFILVYSINDRSTFNLVDTIKKLIDQSKGRRDHPIIVLGNKVDLDIERQVSFDEALIWAKRENIKLFEVTSLERVTLLDFTKYLAVQLTANQSHSTSGFKLRRSKTNQSTSS